MFEGRGVRVVGGMEMFVPDFSNRTCVSLMLY